MTGKILTFSIILITVLVSPVLAMEPFYGSVKKVIDGDSLVIVSGKKRFEVRLYGIDSPEYNQPYSAEAKAMVRKKVKGKRVLVLPEYYDSYKRLVAIVQYEEQILNSELVREGLAWVYPRYCRKKICTSWEKMESSAKREKRGMWNSAQPIPPWKWKRMKQVN